jgi:hypothetical protein
MAKKSSGEKTVHEEIASRFENEKYGFKDTDNVNTPRAAINLADGEVKYATRPWNYLEAACFLGSAQKYAKERGEDKPALYALLAKKADMYIGKMKKTKKELIQEDSQKKKDYERAILLLKDMKKYFNNPKRSEFYQPKGK